MRISTGKGKYTVWLEQHNIGSDVLFILGGGEKTHIGSVVISEPNNPLTVHRFGNHLDHQVLTPLIEAARHHFNTTIVVVGGIHIDNATKQDIDILIQNCKEVTSQIGTAFTKN